MKVTRLTEAQQYEAPEHYGMACLRLQGKEASDTKSMWVGMSQILPAGHTSLKSSPQEKIYICVEGEVTIRTDKEEAVLKPLDTCLLAPGEPRALENRTNRPAVVILVMEETQE